jgi:cellobiose phosphorylase
MYTHAHLRYAEALARHGDAGKFFDALCKANPIGLPTRVTTARPRQANCYHSSSDADFADRYQAYAEYDRAMRGEVAFEGGWRVYSSGAGIGMGLILRCLLGLRREKSALVVDPVLPPELDGLRVELELAGRPVEISYRVGARGCGVQALRLNGAKLPFTRAANPYRTGGAVVAMAEVRARLHEGGNELAVAIG